MSIFCKPPKNMIPNQYDLPSLLKDASHNNYPQLFKDIKKEFGIYMLEKIIEKFIFFQLNEKEVLYKIGDIGNKMFILLSGRLGVYMEFQEISNDLRKVRELLPPQQIGIGALYSPNLKRNQTVIALEQSTLAVISKLDYQQLVGRLRQDLTEKKIGLLQKLDCFQNWSLRQFKTFSHFLIEQNFCLNEIVYKENEESQSIYLVQEGQFEMTVQVQSKKKQFQKKMQTICILNEGEIFGEEAFMTNLEFDPQIPTPFDDSDQTIQRYSTVKCIGITGSLFRISRLDLIERSWDEETKQSFSYLLTQLKCFRLSRIQSLEQFSYLKMHTDSETNTKIKNNFKCQKKSPSSLEPIFTNTYFRKYYEIQQKPFSKYSQLLKPKNKPKQFEILNNPQFSLISPKVSLSKKSQQFHKLLSQRYQRTSQKKESQQMSFEFPSNNIGYIYYKQFIASERAKSLQQ